MIKYTAIVSFKMEIEAFNKDDAAYIANQALPTQFKYANSKGGSGIYLSRLAPVIYEEEEGVDDEREPLSDATIAELWGEEHSGKTDMVKSFARAIEKMHGIGGEK
jgi:hypothetical protein